MSIEGVDMLDGTPLLDIKPYVGVVRRTNRDSLRLARRGQWQGRPLRMTGSKDEYRPQIRAL